ncbi:exonuclease domain-containing protein [Vagococcus sp.]|uniref:exonuclease domain-containing protein n=1 Tax=Vagococcus sp. TaxID=1933889 RepID=UPI003F9E3198
MSVNFVAIDFETANQNRASACSVGLVKIINGEVQDTFYSLINPEDEFDYFNISIHGITSDMVSNSPTYPDVISQINTFVSGFPLVAHYAPFDMGVIRDSNDRYNIKNFKANYFDSYYLSKQYIQSISYKLDYLSGQLGFNFKHHNALEDAMACANLILFLCKKNGAQDVQTLLENARYPKLGVIEGSSGSGFRRKKSHKLSQDLNIKEILESVDRLSLNKEHPFYNTHACFTGKLQSMTRHSAMNLFAQYGGFPEKNVTKKVNFLIMGEQDFRVVGDELKSSKILKAEKLLSQGQDIQLLTEDDFLKMI